MFWPCETRTSTCRSFATISSGFYRFLAIAVLLDVKDIPQVGPLQWWWIKATGEVVARTAIEPHLCALLACNNSGQLIGFCWETRRDEPGRQGTLQHAEINRIGQG